VMSDEEALTMVDGVSALIKDFLAAGEPAAGV